MYWFLVRSNYKEILKIEKLVFSGDDFFLV